MVSSRYRSIRIRGARQNNLADLDLDLPEGALILVCGRSGAGKSSLVFETLYAEGQRLYAETFSPYVRQFLERLPRPKVRLVEGVLPAVSVTQAARIRSGRPWVLDLIEGTHVLQNLFARAAVRLCDQCGEPVPLRTQEEVVAQVLDAHQGERALVVFEVSAGDPHQVREALPGLLAAGYARLLLPSGQVARIEDLADAPSKELVDEWAEQGSITVVADRLVLGPQAAGRLLEAVQAIRDAGAEPAVRLESGERISLRAGRVCARCGLAYGAVRAHVFSADSPLGACPTCGGYGYVLELDPERAIPDRSLSLAEGAVKAFRPSVLSDWQEDLLEACRRRGVDVDRPVQDLPAEDLDWILWGDEGWRGVASLLDHLEEFRHDPKVRIYAARFRRRRLCPDCGGSRLGREARSWRLAGRSFGEVAGLTARELWDWLGGLGLSGEAEAMLVADLRRRCETLMDLGLGHLNLNRLGATLSGGELSRVHLARGLGTGMSGALFVLEEPSTGLHDRDVEGLCRVLLELRDAGNTVVVADNHPALLEAADHVLELGPAGGRQGGRICYQGPPEGIRNSETSVIREYLEPAAGPLVGPRRKPKGWLRLRGASEHNLRDLDVDVPLGVVVGVAGVSGSGKSTLLEPVLFGNLARLCGQETTVPRGRVRAIQGFESLQKVVLADQSPPGRSSRSNPATFMGVLDPLRRLFAKEDRARALGLGPSWFSFNSRQGACPRCRGTGVEVVEMQFLPDLELPCRDCGGRRFAPVVLEVRCRGRTIADILESTVEEVRDLFSDVPAVTRRLDVLRRVGLGYLLIGQRFTTLSAGEAQRLKVARLFLEDLEGALLLLDEPSVGLHPADARLLADLLSDMADQGATVVFADHDPELLARADWLLELGPGGGQEGGRLVAAGPVEEVVEADTATGQVLRRRFGGWETAARAAEAGPRYDAGKRNRNVVELRGASEHNLRHLNLELPRNRLVCITGVSGSGKSSLAFDVLFSEGRRRYLETQQAYVRKFLGPLPRPQIERLSGLPPTVGVSRRLAAGGQRSTVGTITEVAHYMRLLFSRFGTQYCPDCGVALQEATGQQVFWAVAQEASQGRVEILAPVLRRRRGHLGPVLASLRRRGIRRALVDGERHELKGNLRFSRYREHDLDAVVARVDPYSPASAVREAVELALDLGRGTLLLAGEGGTRLLSSTRTCPRCLRGFEPPDPLLFSFNSPRGACPACEGLGLAPGGEWRRHGEPELCPRCGGSRLRPEALAVRIRDWNLAEVSSWSVAEALEKLPELRPGPAAASDLIGEVRLRLQAAEALGLGYLTLDRPAPTLSTGEAQRLRLAAQLGARLRGAAYVLDEPTVGLHPADTQRLVEALRRLVEQGASVYVVEHETAVIRAADWVVDLGPGAGRRGGRVVYQGPPEGLSSCPESVTGRYLGGRLEVPPRSLVPSRGWLVVRGARRHNLRDIEARFQLGALNVVTGVSGSGKSSLVLGVLEPALRAALQGRSVARELADEIVWEGELRAVAVVDESPIGRTPRSVPATYVGLMDRLRRLFAATPGARLRGLGPQAFSFNAPAGACPVCKGQGRIRLEMRLLPDVEVTCEACGGARYRPEILAVRYKGKNLAQVLDMTVEEAKDFFSSVPSLARILGLLEDLGLGYLTLGQPSPTLSGGEAQRIRLAAELKRRRGGTVYLLDEPTTGLHRADVTALLETFRRLVAAGNTLVVVEHDLDVIQAADWIVDLGPGPGAQGGQVVATGPPSQVSRRDTPTGRALAAYLDTSP